MSLSNQATSYVDITSKESVLQSSLGNIAAFSYLQQVHKAMDDVNKAFQGKDTIATGIDKGESRLYNQFTSTFLPGSLKSPTSLGFENLAERQFTPSPFDEYFKLHVAEHRKELKEQMTEQKASKKDILDRMNELYPTKARLKKAGKTREQWLEEHHVEQ